MKVVGIIAEFNPFHKGHQYLIDNLRLDVKPDAIVCVMSGDFMQRGVPALWNKYRRAKMALDAGVDLVIELPTCYAVNAAPEFAKGGISILNKLGCVDYIAFGSECGNIKELEAVIDIEKKKGFKEKLEELLDEGMSYPKAYSIASESPIFEGANNTLAVEYLRQNRKQGAGFKAYTVKRFFGISAEKIREEILNGKADKYSFPRLDWNSRSDERLFALIKYKLLNTPKEELAEVLEVSEGLENRLIDVAKEARTLDDLVQKAKTKRFTYAKVSRILLQMLLGITKKSYKTKPNSVKVLAFNKNGRRILKAAGKYGTLNFDVSKSDAKAHDLYNILIDEEVYQNSDYVINVKPSDNN